MSNRENKRNLAKNKEARRAKIGENSGESKYARKIRLRDRLEESRSVSVDPKNTETLKDVKRLPIDVHAADAVQVVSEPACNGSKTLELRSDFEQATGPELKAFILRNGVELPQEPSKGWSIVTLLNVLKVNGFVPPSKPLKTKEDYQKATLSILIYMCRYHNLALLQQGQACLPDSPKYLRHLLKMARVGPYAQQATLSDATSGGAVNW